MKKILAILLAGMITATALAGCGGGNGGSSSTDSKSDASSGSGSTDASAEKVVDANTVDPELFGDEDNISLKVWAPSQALELHQDLHQHRSFRYGGG